MSGRSQASRPNTFMTALKAHVRGGRRLLDEPTELPEGTEVQLTVVEDDFEPDERVRLDAALEQSAAQGRAGQLVSGGVVIQKLLAA